MKKLALAMAVLMGSAIAMPAMADNYWGQNRAAANHIHHDRQMARKMHRQEVRKIRHDRQMARKMHRQEMRHIRQERRMMHHRPAVVAPAVVIR